MTWKKLVLQKILLQQIELTEFFCPRHASERNSESLLLFLFHGTEFRVGFSSAEWFGKQFQVFASIFVPRNRIPSCFLFRGMVQKGIFCRGFASKFVPRYRIPIIFPLCGMIRNGFPRVFCSKEQPDSAGTNQLFHIFRLPRNNFLSEIANPRTASLHRIDTVPAYLHWRACTATPLSGISWL